jgi:hypothetical protein
VKIQTKTIRKRYGRSKSEYTYKQHLLPFPTAENQALQPFLDKELKFKMNIADDTISITLREEKHENPQNLG